MNEKLKILKELKQHLQHSCNVPVKDVILFGSQVAGKVMSYSDFDVLIVLENDYNYKDENNILDLCYDIGLKYNIIIDTHLITQKEIKSLRGKQPIYINALNNGIYA